MISSNTAMDCTLNQNEHVDAINSFVEILKFKTVSGSAVFDESYNKCAQWIYSKLKHECGLDYVEILEKDSVTNKPLVVAIWKGSNPDLPVVILNSHYDVVPVDEASWTVPAFDGFTQDGKIYGRDEEIGGVDGMNVLLNTPFFREHCAHVAVALDEGLASEDESYSIFYGERLPWWVEFTATGNTGHGSRFIEGTAVEQIVGIANKALAFREEQKQLLHSDFTTETESNSEVTSASVNENVKKRHLHENCSHSVAAKRIKASGRKLALGDVTTLNLTSLHASVTSGGNDVINVVPPSAVAKCDIRIAPHVSPQAIVETLNGWCEEVTKSTAGLPSGGGVKWDFIVKGELKKHSITDVSTLTDESATVMPTAEEVALKTDNLFWLETIQGTLRSEFQIESVPSVFPAATDSRFLRALGIRAFGFSPMRNSPILLHEHDEFLAKDVFLEGCQVYVNLIAKLASVTQT